MNQSPEYPDEVSTQLGLSRQGETGIVDSQSVKTTETGSMRGYDSAKNIKGRTRHRIKTFQWPVRVEQPMRRTRRDWPSSSISYPINGWR